MRAITVTGASSASGAPSVSRIARAMRSAAAPLCQMRECGAGGLDAEGDVAAQHARPRARGARGRRDAPGAGRGRRRCAPARAPRRGARDWRARPPASRPRMTTPPGTGLRLAEALQAHLLGSTASRPGGAGEEDLEAAVALPGGQRSSAGSSASSRRRPSSVALQPALGRPGQVVLPRGRRRGSRGRWSRRRAARCARRCARGRCPPPGAGPSAAPPARGPRGQRLLLRDGVAVALDAGEPFLGGAVAARRQKARRRTISR